MTADFPYAAASAARLLRIALRDGQLLKWHCDWSSLLLLGRHSLILRHSVPIRKPTPSHIIHALGVNTGRRRRRIDTGASLIAALEVYVFHVKGVDVTGEETQDCEQDVYAEVGAAAGD